jgi:hypothetical protein
VNCETVWTSPFAQRLGGSPGCRWRGSASCGSGRGGLCWRPALAARTGRPLRPACCPSGRWRSSARWPASRSWRVDQRRSALPHLPGHLRPGPSLRRGLVRRAARALQPGSGSGPARRAFRRRWSPSAGAPSSCSLQHPHAMASLRGAPARAPARAATCPSSWPAVPTPEKQALADALAHFARTPAPTQPELLPRARVLKARRTHRCTWSSGRTSSVLTAGI